MKINYFITGFFFVFMAAAGNSANADLLYPNGSCVRSDGALVAPCCRTALDGTPYVTCRCSDKNVAASASDGGAVPVKRTTGVSSWPLKDEYRSYETADDMREFVYVGGYWEDDNSYVAIYYRTSTDSNIYNTCGCSDNPENAFPASGRKGAVPAKSGEPVYVWGLKDEYGSDRIWEGTLPGEVHVGGYWRSDGKYVGIYRSDDLDDKPFTYHVCPIDPVSGKAAPESNRALAAKQPPPVETWRLKESYDDYLTRRGQTMDVYAGGYWRSDGVHVTAYYRTVPYNNSDVCNCPFNRPPQTAPPVSENMNAYAPKPAENVQTWGLRDEYKDMSYNDVPYIVNYHGELWRTTNPQQDTFPYYRLSKYDSYYY